MRHRQFALTLLSSFISSSGTWTQSVVLNAYLQDTTHKAVWNAAVTLALWLPAVIGSPLGGVIADRWNRQRWIQINNVIMAICAGILTWGAFTHHLSPWLIFILALVEGLSSSSSWTAWQSLMPELVDRTEIMAAVSLSSAQFNLGRVIGPALGGVLLAAGTYQWAFAFNAASFVFVCVVFFFVRTAPRERRPSGVRFIGEFVEGARAAWANEACRNAISIVLLLSFFISPFITLIAPFVKHVLHEPKAYVGWLTVAQGVGAVIGALLAPSLAHRTSRVLVINGSIALLLVSVAAYGLSPTVVVAFIMMAIVGGAYVGALSGLNSSVQLHAPAAERSRIISLYTLALSVGYPIGALIQAAIGDAIGIRPVTVASAICGAIGLAVMLNRRPHLIRSLGAAPHGTAPTLAT